MYGFELNYGKCKFLRKTIEYLGYIISADGITISTRHTEAIKNFSRPKNVHEVQSFLGLVNYFRKFIKDFALIARPIQNLLRKSTDFVFNEECEEAFVIFKKKLIFYPVLRIYNPKAETELHTDASSLGIVAILLQKQKDGQLAPIF